MICKTGNLNTYCMKSPNRLDTICFSFECATRHINAPPQTTDISGYFPDILTTFHRISGYGTLMYTYMYTKTCVLLIETAPPSIISKQDNALENITRKGTIKLPDGKISSQGNKKCSAHILFFKKSPKLQTAQPSAI